MFIDIGMYPCDVAMFAKHLPVLRKMFAVEDRITAEANRRWTLIVLRILFFFVAFANDCAYISLPQPAQLMLFVLITELTLNNFISQFYPTHNNQR